MKIAIENIIELVTREVIKELTKRGYSIDYTARFNPDIPFHPEKKELQTGPTSMTLCMKEFKTPILTEMRFDEIALSVRELVVPEKTIITPGAYEQLKKRNIKIIHQS